MVNRVPGAREARAACHHVAVAVTGLFTVAAAAVGSPATAAPRMGQVVVPVAGVGDPPSYGFIIEGSVEFPPDDVLIEMWIDIRSSGVACLTLPDLEPLAGKGTITDVAVLDGAQLAFSIDPNAPARTCTTVDDMTSLNAALSGQRFVSIVGFVDLNTGPAEGGGMGSVHVGGGGLNALDVPVRAYDSRVEPEGKVAAGETRRIDLDLHLGQVADGAIVTVTADQTEGAGHLAVHAGDAPAPPTSNLNWTRSGQTVATSAHVAVDDTGHINLTAGPNATHVIIDVTATIVHLPDDHAAFGATRVLDHGQRAYDSRVDAAGQLGPGETRIIQLPVPTHANAAVVTITADRTDGTGYLTVHAADQPTPATSNLNWSAPLETIATSAHVAVDDGGRIAITNGPTATDVIVDLAAYVGEPHPVAGSAIWDTPVRVYDSRPGWADCSAPCEPPGSALAPGETRIIQLPVAIGADAAHVTITADRTAGAGYLTLHRADNPAPATSNLSWDRAGQTIATGALVRVDDHGRIAITNGPSSTHFIIDVTGPHS